MGFSACRYDRLEVDNFWQDGFVPIRGSVGQYVPKSHRRHQTLGICARPSSMSSEERG